MLAKVNDDRAIAESALVTMAAIAAKTLRRVREVADAERRWHLVQIQNSAFKLAHHHLAEAGYEVYAPLIRDMVVPRSNQLSLAARKNRHLMARERLSPFFGSYRFVRFDVNADPWHDIFKLVGVYGIGCANNMPVPMPEEFICGLRGKEINGAIPGSTPVKALAFNVGDRARLTEGPFMGFEGTIERVDEAGRIRLLLQIFAALTPVDCSADEVDKITK